MSGKGDGARCVRLALPAGVAAAFVAAGVMAQAPATYSGPCDASAAVALDERHFVVGNDETNTLQVYRRGETDSVAAIDLAGFLGTAKSESDIEGAAAVGSRIYWITSHARDSKGRVQPERHRFFATDVRPGSPPTVVPAGAPYKRLLDDILASPALARYKLADAARLAAEADRGFNIEGLAATPDGRLLIGLRNPLARGRALLIPLQNPGEVVDRGSRARLGAPIELDLGGRGIRSIELVGDAYFIAAGPPADRGTFAIYRWSGQAAQAPSPVAGATVGTLRPEALFASPGSGELYLLSDDGGVRVDGVECKNLPAARQRFRALTVKP